MSLGEEVRSEIHAGAEKVSVSSRNLMQTRDDLSTLLTYVQRTAAHAQGTYDRMGTTIRALVEGHARVSSAGEGSSDLGPIRDNLNKLMLVMEHLKAEQEMLGPLVEATQELSARFGFEQSPERVESSALAVGDIAIHLHQAAENI